MFFDVKIIKKIMESDEFKFIFGHQFKFIFGHQVELEGGECGGAFVQINDERQYLSQNDMREIHNEFYLLYNMFVIFDNTVVNLNNHDDNDIDEENIIFEQKLENKARIIVIKLKELDIYDMPVYFIN